MKATFNELNHAPKFTPSHRKANGFQAQYSALVTNEDGYTYEAVILRIYGTSAKNYACLWVKGNCSRKGCQGDFWRSSSGSAGGYGYHRPSAAAQEAIHNAGITLSEDIGGRGDSAIEEAVYSIAEAMWEDKKIFTVKANP